MEVKTEVKVDTTKKQQLELSSSLFAGLTSCLTPYLTSIYNSRKLNEIYNSRKLNEIYNQAIYSRRSHSSMEL